MKNPEEQTINSKKLSRKVGRTTRLNPSFPARFKSALNLLTEMPENGATQNDIDAQKHKVHQMLNTMKADPNNAHTVKALVGHMTDDQEKMIQIEAQKKSHGKVKPYNHDGKRQHISSRYQGNVVDISKVTLPTLDILTAEVNAIKAMPVVEIVEVMEKSA